MGEEVDIRPVEVLAHNILGTSHAWAIVHEKQTFIVHPNDVRGDVVKVDGQQRDVIVIECIGREVSLPFSQCKCYPCEPLPPFKPAPWPVFPGEDIISEWADFLQKHRGEIVLVHTHNIDDSESWYLAAVDDYGELTESSDTSTEAVPLFDNYHPARRAGNVWVWEKDSD